MNGELAAKIEAMFVELHADGYDGKHEKVLDIIKAMRMALTPAEGQLGPWETEEVADAEAAVQVNFLLLALNATEKAIAVSQLPRAEYEYGFNYGGRNRR